jgi:hypothetical protein
MMARPVSVRQTPLWGWKAIARPRWPSGSGRAGADGSYVKAEADLSEFAGVPVEARQVERVVQRLAPVVEPWREQMPHERPALPPATFYLSYDMTGVPMRREEVQGRKGKQPGWQRQVAGSEVRLRVHPNRR